MIAYYCEGIPTFTHVWESSRNIFQILSSTDRLRLYEVQQWNETMMRIGLGLKFKEIIFTMTKGPAHGYHLLTLLNPSLTPPHINRRTNIFVL